MKTTKNVAIIGLLLLGLSEISLRLVGLTDFPIYYIDSEIRYLPKPNQHGDFLNKNDWYFNDKSMPTDRTWSSDAKRNIALIGNSIVMGGNPYRQSEKISPLINQSIDKEYFVWPIAVGGWTTENEIAYLDKNRDIERSIVFFAWEYMSGGLSQANSWAGGYVFPLKRPVVATWYVIRRYLIPRVIPGNLANELPAIGEPRADNTLKFDAKLTEFCQYGQDGCHGLIWLYPTKNELLRARNGGEWLPERELIRGIADKHGLKIVDLADYPAWVPALYRPDGVHPSVEGNAVLAGILSGEIIRETRIGAN